MAKRVKHPPVDWDKVPVVITGTPNPEAVRLMWESVREFEIQQLLAKQQAVSQADDDVVGRGSISSS